MRPIFNEKVMRIYGTHKRLTWSNSTGGIKKKKKTFSNFQPNPNALIFSNGGPHQSISHKNSFLLGSTLSCLFSPCLSLAMHHLPLHQYLLHSQPKRTKKNSQSKPRNLRKAKYTTNQ